LNCIKPAIIGILPLKTLTPVFSPKSCLSLEHTLPTVMRQTDRQLKLLEGLTNKQFKAKYKPKALKRRKKSKKERQALTSEQQEKYIKSVQRKKESKNRIKDRVPATKSKNCTTCFHYKGGHCDGVSVKYCCKHYFDPTDPKEWAA